MRGLSAPRLRPANAHPRDAGYTEVSFSGEAVSDRLLQTVAQRGGSGLVRVKVQNAKHLTDTALCALVRSATNLQSFVAEELDKASGGWPAVPAGTRV
jgi:hypothetical protein